MISSIANTYSFIYIRLNDIKYFYVKLTIQFMVSFCLHPFKQLNSPISPIDGTLTVTITINHWKTERNANEWEFSIP